jgi:hypothetical protein
LFAVSMPAEKKPFSPEFAVRVATRVIVDDDTSKRIHFPGDVPVPLTMKLFAKSATPELNAPSDTSPEMLLSRVKVAKLKETTVLVGVVV